MNKSRPIEVPAEVLEGLEAVRDSGVTSMFAWEVVAEEALGMGFEETYDWIYANPRIYGRGVFHGFTSAELEGEEG